LEACPPPGEQRIALEREFLHRISDSVVEAAVERAEFVDVDRLTAIERQIHDRLAEIAIIVDDLVDGETLLQQLEPVLGSGNADLRRSAPAPAGAGNLEAAQRLGSFFDLERADELGEEARYAVFERARGRRRRQAQPDLRAAALDQLFLISREEFVQHGLL